MALGLEDVAPPSILTEEVDIRGTKLAVRGVSGEDWIKLYQRYPDLKVLVAADDTQAASVNSGISRVQSFKAQTSVIAASLGRLDDDKVEALILEKLNKEDRDKIMEVALRLSLPGDVFRPLLEDERGAGVQPDIADQASQVQDSR